MTSFTTDASGAYYTNDDSDFYASSADVRSVNWISGPLLTGTSHTGALTSRAMICREIYPIYRASLFRRANYPAHLLQAAL